MLLCPKRQSNQSAFSCVIKSRSGGLILCLSAQKLNITTWVVYHKRLRTALFKQLFTNRFATYSISPTFVMVSFSRLPFGNSVPTFAAATSAQPSLTVFLRKSSTLRCASSSPKSLSGFSGTPYLNISLRVSIFLPLPLGEVARSDREGELRIAN